METHAAKTIAAASDLEALFRALEDLPAPAHVVAVDRERAFPFVAVNRATEELMQLPRVRILGAPLAEFATVQQAGRDALDAHRDVVETGQPRTYRTFIEHAEGRQFVQCTLTPLCDERGLISHILGIDCEVTADVRSRAESEAELRRTQDHAASVLAALRDGVVEMDLDQRIVAVNDRFCQIVDRPRADVLGRRPPLPWWDRDTLAGASTLWGEHVDSDVAVDMTFVRPDGSRVPVSVSVAVVLDADGQPSGWIGLVRDVSERTRAEQELQIRARADALVAAAVDATRECSRRTGRRGRARRARPVLQARRCRPRGALAGRRDRAPVPTRAQLVAPCDRRHLDRGPSSRRRRRHALGRRARRDERRAHVRAGASTTSRRRRPPSGRCSRSSA